MNGSENRQSCIFTHLESGVVDYRISRPAAIRLNPEKNGWPLQ